jgi:GNAT superfamily N-acetyltransferase
VSAEIVPLNGAHDVTQLNCGVPELDEWLKKTAKTSEERDLARTYVIADEDDQVIAYSALVALSMESSALTSNNRHGLPKFIPAILLGRLAVDLEHKGLGSALLGHACRTAVEVSGKVGARYLFADAMNELARSWYLKKGMKAVNGSNVCYVRIKDLAAQD